MNSSPIGLLGRASTVCGSRRGRGLLAATAVVGATLFLAYVSHGRTSLVVLSIILLVFAFFCKLTPKGLSALLAVAAAVVGIVY